MHQIYLSRYARSFKSATSHRSYRSLSPSDAEKARKKGKQKKLSKEMLESEIRAMQAELSQNDVVA